MTDGHTEESLCRDLLDLGVTPGDTLFIHSSYKSLGPVQGGAGAVVSALERAVGTEGLVLMPSFNLAGKGQERADAWDIERCPSTVGWLTEFFRNMPRTHRSDHYSHSVAGRGKGAEEFVSEHLSQDGMSSPWDRKPWGKTYGVRSPMAKACLAGGKILMLGVDYSSSTYVHYVEVMYWDERKRRDPNAPFARIDRLKAGAHWDSLGRLQRGKVGDADCRLFGIREYVSTLLAEVRRAPESLLMS